METDKKRSRGLFITFEGAEGSGKTTQARLLNEFLQAGGREAVLTREPGGTGISEKIRDIILDVNNADMSPVTEALLFAASRAQHVSSLIRPALDSGRIVICDRFVDSSVAYQVYARGLDLAEVSGVNEFAVQGCLPDVTFFLDIDPVLAMARKKGEIPDRLEAEATEFHQKVSEGYKRIAAQNPNRFFRVDALLPSETIHSIITGHILNILK